MEITIIQEGEFEETQKLIERTISESFKLFYPDCSIQYLVEALGVEELKSRASKGHFYVAKIGSEIVGTGAISISDGDTDALITNVFVSPNLQGKGIGKMIMQKLENDSIFKASKRIEVPASVIGLPFYKKLGYTHKNNELVIEDGCFILEKFNN